MQFNSYLCILAVVPLLSPVISWQHGSETRSLKPLECFQRNVLYLRRIRICNGLGNCLDEEFRFYTTYDYNQLNDQPDYEDDSLATTLPEKDAD